MQVSRSRSNFPDLERSIKKVYLASVNELSKQVPTASQLLDKRPHFVVDGIKEASPASIAGVQKGDLILGIADDGRYYEAEEFASNFSDILVKRPPKMTFLMSRGSLARFVSIGTEGGQSALNSNIFAPIGIVVSSVNFNFDELITASTSNTQSNTSPFCNLRCIYKSDNHFFKRRYRAKQ